MHERTINISVITATYNRRDMLRRVFKSLTEQQYDGIEWIVVDDGGVDNTAEVIGEFQQQARFVIRHIRQENAGKPTAVNRGLDLATGDILCVVDDDDYFLPNVFAQVVRDYAEIANLDKVAALSYLTVNPDGKVWGSPFPEDRAVSDHYSYRINRKAWGDKCEFTKIKALRAESLRYYEGNARGGIGGDALFFFAVADHYDTCYVNVPVLVKDYQPDGISVNWRRKALQNPQRTARYYAAYLNERIRLSVRLRYMIAYVAIARYAGRMVRLTEMRSVSNRILLCISYFPGIALGWRWKRYKSGAIPQATKWMSTKSQ
jgi:glycosyltransferase involved in cell wall biosynthesis